MYKLNMNEKACAGMRSRMKKKIRARNVQTDDYRQKRKKKRIAGKCLILAAGVVLLFFIFRTTLHKPSDTAGFSEKYINLMELPEYLQFTYYIDTEWKEQLKEKLDLDVETGGYFTYGQLEDILKLLKVEDYVEIPEKKLTSYVKRTEWNLIYEQLLELLDTSGKVKKQPVFILEQVMEDQGSTIYAQLPDALTLSTPQKLEQRKVYEMYLFGDQILGICGDSEKAITLSNTFVTGADDKITFLYQKREYTLPVTLQEKIENTVCDLSFEDGEITKIQKKSDSIEGKLLTLSDEKVEIDGYGVIDRAKELPVYQVYDTVTQKDLTDIVLGNMNISYIVADKCVCAILLKEPAQIKTVRVLLLDGSSTIHANVWVKSDSDCTVSVGKNTEKKEAGSMIAASDYLKEAFGDSLKIEPSEDGRLTLCDETGKETSLPYRGSFEIRRQEDGYALVNVLPMEQYLYGVVVSEMMAACPMEALKTQAVCARSYAYIQMMRGDYAYLGAHMDDSTNYQVYNKQAEDAAACQAVDATTGQVISYEGQVVEAYYYSTSYGHSGDMQSWNLETDGANGYLKGVWLRKEPQKLDLSDEKAFAEYIQTPDEDCYDSFANYFRWHAVLGIADAAGSDASIAQVNLRKAAKPDSVSIKKDGKEKEQAAGFGKITGVNIQKRTSCGGVCSLLLAYEHGTVVLSDEYSIRSVLGTFLTGVTGQDGKERTDMSVLPSSYFAITEAGGDTIQLAGGGYGHGIGMSQNGAKGMADAGMNCEEILKNFYSGIELVNCYEEE